MKVEQKLAKKRPLASLSLDLDNLWAYLRTHGDAGHEHYPSYLHTVLPLALDTMEQAGLKFTVFVVGKDAEHSEHGELLRSIPARGHEVGNHSLNHFQWMHRLPPQDLVHEIGQADRLITQATGQKPRGFRGPGFACSKALLRILADMGYEYDCSTFPTYLGPLARAYYFFSAPKLSPTEADQRKELFGSLADGLRPLGGYLWTFPPADGPPPRPLLEIPVTTVPIVRTPFHMSYLLFLAQRSRFIMRQYLNVALRLCLYRGVEPSFLLHPLDFISGAQCPALRFFPAMDMPGETKRALVLEALAHLGQHFQIVPLGDHARSLKSRALARRQPDFKT